MRRSRLKSSRKAAKLAKTNHIPANLASFAALREITYPLFGQFLSVSAPLVRRAALCERKPANESPCGETRNVRSCALSHRGGLAHMSTQRYDSFMYMTLRPLRALR